MCWLYVKLLRLYPDDIRWAYGNQMAASFQGEFNKTRQRGLAVAAAFAFTQLVTLFGDATAERVNSLYSHLSFHGRCRPDPSVVRPPNMGKQEWFHDDRQR